MIKSSSIEALKQQINILEVIGSYIDLKKMGSNYGACCPFHSEKTPSFMVHPAKNIYHCYGCGVSGDSISFIMEYEKLDFVQTIEKLAQMFNFGLEYEDKQKHQEKERENKAFTSMIEFYHQRLMHNESILSYLLNRGVSQESIAKFHLGFCPESLDNITFCDRNAIDKNLLVELAVLGYDRGRYYARFNQRIMFPIYSPNAKPVGFGGRSLQNNVAKYINSPQSTFFNKSRLLYGYHLAKEHIYRKNQIIVTEGYLDVIMLHQAGFNTAVATLGTALTADHLPLINKGDPQVILSYDGDKAGIKAAFRAAQMLYNKEGGVVLFDGGVDPADMVAQGRLEELREKFSQPMPFIEFILRQIPLDFDLSNPLQKEKAIQEVLKFLHTLSPFLQEEYQKVASSILGISPHLLKIQRIKRSKEQTKSFPLTPEASNEAIVLRYLIEDRRLLDVALEYIDEGIFENHQNAFKALIYGENHADLNSIALNPNLIIPLESRDESFKKELRLLIMRYNIKLLDSVQRNNQLSFTQKSFEIRKIKQNILRLKQGELFAYESISTF